MTARFHFSLPGIGRSGSTAAEFALVLPLLMLLLFGILDAGRLMWTWNRAEKAAQMGVRMAVVTDMVPGGLYTEDFSDTLGQGVPVPVGSFGSATCTKPSAAVSCSCSGTCPTLTPYNEAAFDAVVARMRAFFPELTAANVAIDYANSGLGYSGDPNGPDVAPIVTVRIVNMDFQPITGMLFGASISMPEFKSDLTLEDGSGTVSN